MCESYKMRSVAIFAIVIWYISIRYHEVCTMHEL